MSASFTPTVLPAPRETIPSYVSRLAASKGVSARVLCLDMGLSLKRMVKLEDEAIAALKRVGGLSDQQVDTLLSWTGVSVGDVQMQFRGETFGSRALRNPVMRGCLKCLAEGAASQPDEPLAAMVMRGEWQLRDAGICIQHKAPLAELWEKRKLDDRYDIGARLYEISEMLHSTHAEQPREELSAYDHWLDRRLASGTDSTWMRDLSLYAATTICGLLGEELLKEEGISSIPANARHRLALRRGFDVLRQGKTSLKDTLDRLASRADGHLDQPQKAFGNLYSRTSRFLVDNEAFRPFTDILRETILSHWPYGLGETVLGQPVRERHLHSVLSAARETGICHTVLDPILSDAGAFEPDDSRPMSRKTFIAKDYASLLAEIPTWVGPGEMKAAMGTTKTAFVSLVADGVLLPRTSAPKVAARWRLSDGLALVQELAAIAKPTPADPRGLESLQLAKQRKGIPVGTIISKVRTGDLSIFRQPDEAGYRGFRVRVTEIDAYSARIAATASPAAELQNSISAAAFGRKVGLRDGGHFLALTDAGYVATQVVRHPVTRQNQHRMTAQHIAAFHRKFLTLTTIKAEFGLHRNTILALLKAAGAKPFRLNGQSVGSIWLRDEVESIFVSSRRF